MLSGVADAVINQDAGHEVRSSCRLALAALSGERVLPEQHALPCPDPDEHLEWACSSAAERLWIFTPKELAEFWNSIEAPAAKRAEVKLKIAAALTNGLRM